MGRLLSGAYAAMGIAVVALNHPSLWGADDSARLAPASMPALVVKHKSVAEDPLAWKPGAPVLDVEPVLTEEVYAARKAEVAGEIRKEGLDNPLYPQSGLWFLTVVPGGRADASGIQRLEVLTAVNGKPTNEGDFGRTVHGGEDFGLTVCTPGSAAREIKFSAGPIQVNDSEYVDLPRIYWARYPHDARWDDDVLVAANRCQLEADLAQTALAHAIKAGWSGPFCQFLTAETEYKAGRYEDALRTGLPLLPTLPKELRACLAGGLNDSARLCYHWNISERLKRDYPDDFTETLSEEFTTLAAYHRSMPVDFRISRPPVEVAAESVTEDLTGRIEDVASMTIAGRDSWWKEVDWQNQPFDLAGWQKNHALEFSRATGYGITVDIGPAVENAIMSAEFTCHEHDAAPEFMNGKEFSVAIIDYSPKEKEGVVAFSTGITPSGYADIRSPEFGTMWAPRQYIPEVKHLIRLVAVKRRINVLIDNQIVFDGLLKPIHADRQLVGGFFVRGMDATVTNVEWRKVILPVAETNPAGSR